MEPKSHAAPRTPRPAPEDRPRRALDQRAERPTAARRDERQRDPTSGDGCSAHVERFGPLPGEVYADEARFGSFN